MKLSEELKNAIVHQLTPLNLEKVVLFGSYAYGHPNEHSDIDLYVVTSDEYMPKNWREKSMIFLPIIKTLDEIQKNIPIDLIAHTKPMYQKFVKLDGMLSRKILRDGIALV
ncbi:MAG: nucleotidyltransferase domain-containing protein [Sulfuricurvum sp.]